MIKSLHLVIDLDRMDQRPSSMPKWHKTYKSRIWVLSQSSGKTSSISALANAPIAYADEEGSHWHPVQAKFNADNEKCHSLLSSMIMSMIMNDTLAY